jgi:hypothetical protein
VTLTTPMTLGRGKRSSTGGRLLGTEPFSRRRGDLVVRELSGTVEAGDADGRAACGRAT